MTAVKKSFSASYLRQLHRKLSGWCIDCNTPSQGKWRCEKCRKRLNKRRREMNFYQ